jgi:ribonuclease HIII
VTLSGNIIGVDESGKGDFFGPLVVAGLLAGEARLPFLKESGVRDSKRVSDSRILSLDRLLRAEFVHHLVVVMPEEYNRRYEKLRNLNIMLADCHAQVIAAIVREAAERRLTVDLAVSDKFGKTERLESALARTACQIPAVQMVRGEAVLQVAAASILARAEFIRCLQRLSEGVGMELPKGASAQVDEAGRRLVADRGPGCLQQVAKKHFKNFGRAMSTDMFGRQKK